MSEIRCRYLNVNVNSFSTQVVIMCEKMAMKLLKGKRVLACANGGSNIIIFGTKSIENK
uniref:Uncharacterized protein n=1 Tax=Medicago truncatula TaxID=3880 RepID=I3S2X4_MEDTR|nr:unknown [Medicago truncatula]